MTADTEHKQEKSPILETLINSIIPGTGFGVDQVVEYMRKGSPDEIDTILKKAQVILKVKFATLDIFISHLQNLNSNKESFGDNDLNARAALAQTGGGIAVDATSTYTGMKVGQGVGAGVGCAIGAAGGAVAGGVGAVPGCVAGAATGARVGGIVGAGVGSIGGTYTYENVPIVDGKSGFDLIGDMTRGERTGELGKDEKTGQKTDNTQAGNSGTETKFTPIPPDTEDNFQKADPLKFTGQSKSEEQGPPIPQPPKMEQPTPKSDNTNHNEHNPPPKPESTFKNPNSGGGGAPKTDSTFFDKFQTINEAIKGINSNPQGNPEFGDVFGAFSKGTYEGGLAGLSKNLFEPFWYWKGNVGIPGNEFNAFGNILNAKFSVPNNPAGNQPGGWNSFNGPFPWTFLGANTQHSTPEISAFNSQMPKFASTFYESRANFAQHNTFENLANHFQVPTHDWSNLQRQVNDDNFFRGFENTFKGSAWERAVNMQESIQDRWVNRIKENTMNPFEKAMRDGYPGNHQFGGGRFPPIAIGLRGKDKIDLVPYKDSAVFANLLDNGFLQNTAWVGSQDAILAYDHNHNKVIDEAKEISFIKWDTNARTDMEGLKLKFDTNKDGKLDPNDAEIEHFYLWQDLNQDGASEAKELTRFLDSGIKAISLEYTPIEDVGLKELGVIHLSNVIWDSGKETTAYDLTFTHSLAGLKIDPNGEILINYGDVNASNIYLPANLSERVKLHSMNNTYGLIVGSKRNDDIHVFGIVVNKVTSLGNGVIIDAGDGDDIIFAHTVGGWIKGGAGNDYIQTGGGHDVLFIDADDRHVDAGGGYDVAFVTSSKGIKIDLAKAHLEAIYCNSGNDKVDASKVKLAINDNLTKEISKEREALYTKLEATVQERIKQGATHSEAGEWRQAEIAKFEAGAKAKLAGGQYVRVSAGDGDDEVIGSDYTDIVDLGKGKDKANLGKGDDVLYIDYDDYLYQIDLGEGDDAVHVSGDKGVNLDLDSINAEQFFGGKASNYVRASGNKDYRFIGEGGNNDFRGGSGNNVFQSTWGNNTFRGGIGNNFYTFSKDSGHVTIYAAGKNREGKKDFVLLSPSIKMKDIIYQDSYGLKDLHIGDLVLKINGTDSSLILKHWFSADNYKTDGIIYNAFSKKQYSYLEPFQIREDLKVRDLYVEGLYGLWNDANPSNNDFTERLWHMVLNGDAEDVHKVLETNPSYKFNLASLVSLFWLPVISNNTATYEVSSQIANSPEFKEAATQNGIFDIFINLTKITRASEAMHLGSLGFNNWWQGSRLDVRAQYIKQYKENEVAVIAAAKSAITEKSNSLDAKLHMVHCTVVQGKGKDECFDLIVMNDIKKLVNDRMNEYPKNLIKYFKNTILKTKQEAEAKMLEKTSSEIEGCKRFLSDTGLTIPEEAFAFSGPEKLILFSIDASNVLSSLVDTLVSTFTVSTESIMESVYS
jgi:RTX calcium-binding nonapeptide repeat (4 copies)